MSPRYQVVVGVLLQAVCSYCIGSPLPFYSTTGGDYFSPPPVPSHTEAYFLPSPVAQSPEPSYYPPVYSAIKASYAIPPSRPPHSHLPEEYYEDGSQYEFSYEIRDAGQGQEFGHRESRYGSEVRGSYSVLLPDGRRQIVEYTAGPGGYNPVIRYEPAY